MNQRKGWLRRVSALGALVPITTSACSGDTPVYEADPPLIVHHLEGEMDGQVVGYLTYVTAANCLVLS
jgi:hypothetical protein